MTSIPCKKCLLSEIDDKELLQSIQEKILSMPEEEKASPILYERRLAACVICGQLLNGTCVQCGCFVEWRAAKMNMHCPLSDPCW